MKNNKKTIVIISGYFNPVHIGHIDMINHASSLGDLYVIVNNDAQVFLKGSVPFMKDTDRVKILKNIKGVEKAILSVDDDKTVCKTIEKICNDINKEEYNIIFANGGDKRNLDDIPEASICKHFNIEMLFGIGGEKIESSSSLIVKAKDYLKDKI